MSVHYVIISGCWFTQRRVISMCHVMSRKSVVLPANDAASRRLFSSQVRGENVSITHSVMMGAQHESIVRVSLLSHTTHNPLPSDPTLNGGYH